MLAHCSAESMNDLVSQITQSERSEMFIADYVFANIQPTHRRGKSERPDCARGWPPSSVFGATVKVDANNLVMMTGEFVTSQICKRSAFAHLSDKLVL